jgi:hypothetical protein
MTRKLKAKLIVSLMIVSVMVLIVGAANQTSNITENQTTNTTNESIYNVTATATVTATTTGNLTPNETAMPVNTNGSTNTTQVVNKNITQNNNQNVNVTVLAPITTEEKNIAINIAINFTVNNIGIDNPKVLDVTRKDRDHLRVRVRDVTGENIVLLIAPGGAVNEEIPVVPVFVETQNNFAGNHISFQFTNNSILNYTLDEKLIFKSIKLGFNSTKVRRTGSTLRISDATNTVIIYDNSNGIITESASNAIESTYTVVPETNVDEVAGNRVNLIDHIKGSIIGSDTDSVVLLAAGNIISEKINHGKTTFTANVLGVRSTQEYDFEDRVVEGIYNKRIGNIVDIDSEDSHNIVGFGVDTTVNRAVHNTVSLNVNSDSAEGRTVVLRARKDMFPNQNLRILVDGNEIKQAKDFDDLFKNDKYAYLTVIGQNVEVLVSIPSFSEHEILVTSELQAASVTGTAIVTSTIVSTPSVVTTTVAATNPAVIPRAPGFKLGIVLVAMSVLYLMFRKNR